MKKFDEHALWEGKWEKKYEDTNWKRKRKIYIIECMQLEKKKNVEKR